MRRQIVLALLLLLTHQHSFTQINIGQRTLHFRDSARHRPIITEVWYPTEDTLPQTDKTFSAFTRKTTVRNGSLPAGKWPLIMLSHGTGGGRLTLEWLSQALAEKGYIVAAVDHYGNTYDNPIALEFLKVWERPQDISFALTQLLKDNDLQSHIDQQKIGAIGFSLGGYTVIALAGGEVNYTTLINFNKTVGRKQLDIPEFPGLIKYLDDTAITAGVKRVPPLKDSRIKAFFSISPALGPGFTTKQQFKNISAPVYITGSQSDSIAPIKSNAWHYHQLIDHSGYYEFPGKTGHYVMLGEVIDEVKKKDPIYFQDAPSVNRHEVHLQIDSLAINFFKTHLPPR
ncbi:MAG: dienelactone hydrolase family protein [Chitinophagaceae bacterium]|nr:dienelactone hydrolase family protein [Chitinophagaceae bacterium]